MATGGLAGRLDQPVPDPPLQGANAHSNSPCGDTGREKTPVSHVLTLGSGGALETGLGAIGTLVARLVPIRVPSRSLVRRRATWMGHRTGVQRRGGMDDGTEPVLPKGRPL